jgi:hypothetical protein
MIFSSSFWLLLLLVLFACGQIQLKPASLWRGPFIPVVKMLLTRESEINLGAQARAGGQVGAEERASRRRN